MSSQILCFNKTTLIVMKPASEKSVHYRCHFAGTGYQEKVAIVQNDELRLGNEVFENPRIRKRDDRIVRPCYDQGVLMQSMQPRQASPAPKR